MQNSVKLFHDNMFSGQFNANDFFAYACAQMVQIAGEDFTWIVDHIEKHGQSGMDSAMAYIQNQEPIKPHLTENFNRALTELIERKQEVFGDIDWDFYGYNDNGTYRNINKDYYNND